MDEGRYIPLPLIPPTLPAARLAELMDSEVELLRGFVRHLRLFERVLKGEHPEWDLSPVSEMDSGLVNSLAYLQEQADKMKALAEMEGNEQ